MYSHTRSVIFAARTVVLLYVCVCVLGGRFVRTRILQYVEVGSTLVLSHQMKKRVDPLDGRKLSTANTTHDPI